MKRVAFYTRISTDEDKQKYSLDAQCDRLKLFCQGLYGDDFELVEIYRDAESGAKIDRPALEPMQAHDGTLQGFTFAPSPWVSPGAF